MLRRVLILALLTATRGHAQSLPRPGDWWAYGRDAEGSRFSPLDQINPSNVGTLTVAWTFRTGDTAMTRRPVKFEATPLVVDGTMFLSTPFGEAIALDPGTGKVLWRYAAGVNRQDNWGDFASRGVSTWLDPRVPPSGPCRRRILLPTIDARIIALDSRTGKPCSGFGDGGTVTLRRNLHNPPSEASEYELTSPPAVVNGLIVTGSAVADNGRTNAASGEVRAFDARTGALRWTWDPVPRDSADPEWNSWRGPMARSTGAANAWSVIAADPARDLVFVPTGSPSPDYYGGERRGDNRYANSITALKASTGKVVWSFQTVHHDLWDYDNASPPMLVTLQRDGRPVAAVLQATKSGQLFVLDRATGRPLFPVEERAVPRSAIAGEQSAPTQPFNSVLPPLSPQAFSLDSVFGPTPADREACLAQLSPLRNDGVFTPPSLQGTLQRPSNVGGAHWGGLGFDPLHAIAVVPVNRLVAMVQLIPVDQLDTALMHSNASRLGDEYTRMHGTPYLMRRGFPKSPSGAPCSPPPFGTLVALDLAHGTRLWEKPLNLNLGGPIVTAGGIVFIGASIDHLLRAFDVQTGEELWKGPLPGGARATPMTYEHHGKQYVAIAVGGSELWGKGDYLVAFALP